jgi:Cu2+-exporting ATPase
VARVSGCASARRPSVANSHRSSPRPAAALPLLWIALVSEKSPLAWIGLNDELRGEAPGVMCSAWRDSGCAASSSPVTPHRARRRSAKSSASRHTATGQSPEDKLARVAALQGQGAVVTMVGDGLNDAPVLQRADVSIAVAGATDLARAQADFVIQRGDLTRIELLVATAQRTRRIIRQNFAWALGYNGIGIPLAAMGWIPPWAAALGMSASSLIVVATRRGCARDRC